MAKTRWAKPGVRHPTERVHDDLRPVARLELQGDARQDQAEEADHDQVVVEPVKGAEASVDQVRLGPGAEVPPGRGGGDRRHQCPPFLK